MSCFYPVLGYEREKRLVMPGMELGARWVVLRTEDTTWPFTAGEPKALADTAVHSGRYENLSHVEGSYVLRRVRGPSRPRVRGSPLSR